MKWLAFRTVYIVRTEEQSSKNNTEKNDKMMFLILTVKSRCMCVYTWIEKRMHARVAFLHHRRCSTCAPQHPMLYATELFHSLTFSFE